ncbi:MAG: HSP90 family protein [Oscillospiraceae bacterium]|nr:HSP90 family protein [Oscillospiraceae bacterium]
MAEPFVFKVNLGGMIDILANHLYSSPDVFIRELLQNGTDAISGRRLQDASFGEGCIRIAVTEGESLTFTDNGTGLTEEEIHQFLAVIGQSSKRDLETGRILEDYIGRFGIGMLSCFMVTDEIRLRTCSVKDPSRVYEWVGKPDGTYVITPSETAMEPGTAIFIPAKKGFETYFREEKICELVRYYGLPLPFPVMMEGAEETYRINRWFEQTQGASAEEHIMRLGSEIFGSEFLTYIPLESASGLFSGVAYILPHTVSVHAKNQHRIYLKNMLLTTDGESILPRWSGFLQCFLNTTQLRPTASRESFYEDELLQQAREELGKCISEYLMGLSRTKPELLEEIIDIHGMTIKSMAEEDERFFRTFVPFLKFETNMGTFTGRELMIRRDPVAVTRSINQFHRTSALMLAQGQLLVNACYVYDASLLVRMAEFEENMQIYSLTAVDFDEFLEEPSVQTQVDAKALVQAASESLRRFDCQVQLKSFSPADLPVFYMLDDSAETKREIEHSLEHSDALFASMLRSFASEIEDYKSVLYLNALNPLIRRLMGLDDTKRQRVCVEILYVQALLTGRFPLQGGELPLLNENLITLIGWGTEGGTDHA